MGASDFFSKISKRFKSKKQQPQPIRPDNQEEEPFDQEEPREMTTWSGRKPKAASIEKLQEGFDNLIDKLQGINEHLDKTVSQQNELMQRIEKLPGLLESFPSYTESQLQTNKELLEHLKSSSAKDEQLIQAVEKLPTQANRQTETLADINRQLSIVADGDRQMNESFTDFKSAVDKLNSNTESTVKSIETMNSSFTTSDQDLKTLIQIHNKRFTWVFIGAMGVCLIAIIALAGIIVYLTQTAG